MAIPIFPNDALLVVDIQNDFLPGGSLAVDRGDEIIPLVNRLLPLFSHRIFTRDWHPADHVSFAPAPAFVDKSWPSHCVQDTPGATFPELLKHQLADLIVNKGTDPRIEAYSGFQGTNLSAWLKDQLIQRIFVVGLATDYCVKATVLDALAQNFNAVVVVDAVRGVDNPKGNSQRALDEMLVAGASLAYSQELTKP